MGHADVMSTLPRSQADRTNNSDHTHANIHVHHISRMFYGRLRQACTPTGVAQTHNGVATLSRYYTPPPLFLCFHAWVCGGCLGAFLHLDLHELSSVCYQARSLSSPVAGALYPPCGRRSLSSQAAGALCPPRRQALSVLPGGRRSLSSPAAGTLCPPRRQALSVLPGGRHSSVLPGGRRFILPGGRCSSVLPGGRRSILPGGRSPSQRGGAFVLHRRAGVRPSSLRGAGILGSLLVYPRRQCVVSRMGHADVMSTLPRSPADRTNNSDHTRANIQYIHVHHISRIFYGRLLLACAPTGAAQTHNGVATLSRYYR